MKTVPKYRNLIWALLFGLIAFLIAYGGRNKPGVTPDSVRYLRTADSLMERDGFFVKGEYGPFPGDGERPFTSWPPFFPLMIAFFSIFFDTIIAARIIILGSFALLPAALIYLGRESGCSTAGRIAGALVVISPVMLHSAWHIWTEIPFTLFLIISTALLIRIHRESEPDTSLILICATATAAAIMTRYVGILLLPIGYIILRRKKDGGFRKIALYFSPAVILLSTWIFRNFLVSGNLSGNRVASTIGIGDNLSAFLELVPNAFVFGSSKARLMISPVFWLYGTWILLGVGLILVIAVFKGELKPEIRGNWSGVVISLVSGLSVIGFYIVLRSIIAFDDINPRFLAPGLPLIVFGIVAAIVRLTEKRLLVSCLFGAIFLGIISMQLVSTIDLGVTEYDGIDANSMANRFDFSYVYLENMAKGKDIYTDNESRVLWLLDRPCHSLPKSGDIERWIDIVESGLLVFFRPGNWRKNEMTPFEARLLERKGKIRMVKQFEDGKQIYEITSD